MGQQTINNGESGLVVRGKINDNFTELYTFKETTNVRGLTYYSVASGTSGTVTKPTGSTVVLDQFPAGVDCLVSQITSGTPNFESAVTSGGVVITGTLDGSGNYTLSGTPSAYPVAVLFWVSVPLDQFDAADYIGDVEINPTTFSGILTTAELRGCKGTLVTATPSNGNTVTIDYAATDTLYLDLTNITTGNSVTLAMSNVPAGAVCASFTINIKTAATVGTVSWPSGFTAPTLTANKMLWYTAATRDNGTTWRLFKAGEF